MNRPAQRANGAVAVVLAGGSGTRMGSDRNKAYLPLVGRPMVSWSLAAVAQAQEFTRVVLVTRPEDREMAAELLERDVPELAVDIVDGGSSRHGSEFAALQHLAPDIDTGTVDVVVLHDAARPLAGPEMMRAAVRVAREFGGAIPALGAGDVLKVDPERGIDVVNSSGLVRVQTPQAFRAAPLLRAYREADAAQFEGTDTSACVERYGDVDVHTFPGAASNLKVTFQHDRAVAERLLADGVRG